MSKFITAWRWCFGAYIDDQGVNFICTRVMPVQANVSV